MSLEEQILDALTEPMPFPQIVAGMRRKGSTQASVEDHTCLRGLLDKGDVTCDEVRRGESMDRIYTRAKSHRRIDEPFEPAW